MKRLTSNPAYLHPAMFAGLLKNVAAADNCMSGQEKKRGGGRRGGKRSEVTVQWERHHGGSGRISLCPAISPYTHTHTSAHGHRHAHTERGDTCGYSVSHPELQVSSTFCLNVSSADVGMLLADTGITICHPNWLQVGEFSIEKENNHQNKTNFMKGGGFNTGKTVCRNDNCPVKFPFRWGKPKTSIYFLIY